MKNIFIIHADEGMRYIYKEILSINPNYKIYEFDNMKDPIVALSETKCDLIMMNLMTPKNSSTCGGLNFMKFLKENNVKIPVLVISVEASVLFETSGICEFRYIEITPEKELSIEELLNKVEKMIYEKG